MRTYIINLKRCPERKLHMERLLSQYSFLDIEFVEAVDGKRLSEKEKIERFDQNKAFRLYGRYLSDGEIGCTLSHQLCYCKIKEGKDDYALILEDDLFIKNSNIHQILENVGRVLTNSRPEVLLLSGDYWWLNKKEWRDNHSIVSVYDASCTQSYVINKKAAILLSTDIPYFIADDWLLFKQKVDLQAIFPHLMDQNRVDFSTEVVATNIGIIRNQMSLKRNLYYYVNSLIKGFLYQIGHFEAKDFKDGKE